DQRYSRAHNWMFDGGAEVAASSSPHSVPIPLSDPRAVDPEEAFVASLSSCHMLWFLSIAAAHGFLVESYTDAATGTMGRNAAGQVAFTEVTLSPLTVFAGEKVPTAEELEDLHRLAHHNCFIASSVRAAIHCNPTMQRA